MLSLAGGWGKDGGMGAPGLEREETFSVDFLLETFWCWDVDDLLFATGQWQSCCQGRTSGQDRVKERGQRLQQWPRAKGLLLVSRSRENLPDCPPGR